MSMYKANVLSLCSIANLNATVRGLESVHRLQSSPTRLAERDVLAEHLLVAVDISPVRLELPNLLTERRARELIQIK